MDPEDEKVVTLARAARARTGAAQGAAVRDDTGRTYAASTVALPSLRLSALAAAVAAAVSSGARGFEAVAVAGAGEAGELGATDRDLLADLGNPPLWLVGADGSVRAG